MPNQVNHLSQIELLPVLRISPFDFDEPSYPFKTQVDTETLYQYWKSVLRKNGLPDLEPIRKGLNFVSIREVDHSSLEKLIELCLSDDFTYNQEEGVFSFTGGIVLRSEGKVIISPQCCVSLEDYREWTRIDRHSEFERIWIGHPWIYYRVEKDKLFLTRLIEKTFDKTSWRHYNTPDNTILMDASDFEEKTIKEITERDIKYTVSFTEMKGAIEKMKMDLEDFKGKIIEVLEQKDQTHAEEIAQGFINGNGKFLSYDPNDSD